MEFTLTSTFNASAQDVFTAWLNSKMHTEMTGGEATISDVVASTFSAWDGYIEGQNLVVEPFTRIVQTWRTTEFDPSDEDSQIEILFEETDGMTKLTLIHSLLPESGEQYINGWRNHYFAPMKEYFD